MSTEPSRKPSNRPKLVELQSHETSIYGLKYDLHEDFCKNLFFDFAVLMVKHFCICITVEGWRLKKLSCLLRENAIGNLVRYLLRGDLERSVGLHLCGVKFKFL